MVQVITCKENQFTDFTEKPFKYVYPKTEMVDGHKFVHLDKGIFLAEPGFYVSKRELISLLRTYRDLVFYVAIRQNKLLILF